MRLGTGKKTAAMSANNTLEIMYRFSHTRDLEDFETVGLFKNEKDPTVFEAFNAHGTRFESSSKLADNYHFQHPDFSV